jgi:hypothetical protein
MVKPLDRRLIPFIPGLTTSYQVKAVELLHTQMSSIWDNVVRGRDFTGLVDARLNHP